MFYTMGSPIVLGDAGRFPPTSVRDARRLAEEIRQRQLSAMIVTCLRARTRSAVRAATVCRR